MYGNIIGSPWNAEGGGPYNILFKLMKIDGRTLCAPTF